MDSNPAARAIRSSPCEAAGAFHLHPETECALPTASSPSQGAERPRVTCRSAAARGRRAGGESRYFLARLVCVAWCFVLSGSLKSPIIPFKGQAENAGHFLHPTANATGHRVMRLPLLRRRDARLASRWRASHSRARHDRATGVAPSPAEACREVYASTTAMCRPKPFRGPEPLEPSGQKRPWQETVGAAPCHVARIRPYWLPNRS